MEKKEKRRIKKEQIWENSIDALVILTDLKLCLPCLLRGYNFV